MDLKREFPYWGEVGRWVGVMRLEWVYVRDAEFHNTEKLIEQSPTDGSIRYMQDMTDGSRLGDINARALVKMMNDKPEMSLIFKKFVGHDHQEKQLRASVEEIIRTNMMDDYKKKVQKRDEQRAEPPKQQEVAEIVVKKKVSQAEMKKMKKQQQEKEKGEES